MIGKQYSPSGESAVDSDGHRSDRQLPDVWPALAVGVRWLATRTDRKTITRYERVLGLGYTAHQLGWCGELAALAESYRLPIRCGPPGEHAHAPHLAWLPWTLARGLDPLSAEVCDDFAPVWARDMLDWRGPHGQYLSGNTRRVRVGAVREFYRWATRQPQRACCNPFDGYRYHELALRQGDRASGHTVSRGQLAELQLAADRYPAASSDWHRARASVLVALLIDTGVRLEELRRVQVCHYQPPTADRPGTLVIPDAKGHIVRRCTLSAPTCDRIADWLNDHRPELVIPGAHRDVPMLPSKARRNTVIFRGSGRITRDMINYTLQSVCRASGVAELADPAHWLTVQTIRASLLTIGHDDGIPTHDLAAWIGHAQDSTTAGYDRHHAQRGYRVGEHMRRAYTDALRDRKQQRGDC